MLLKPNVKECWTDSHVYFLKGPGSNWHPSAFKMALVQGGEEFSFSHNEQYMMAGKEVLLNGINLDPPGNDNAPVSLLSRILASTNPKDQKAFGREVRNWDQAKWEANARDIVFRGAYGKFSQNPALEAWLVSTGDRIIVEGAWYDPVWGVKLAWDDPLILDEANWRGTNWLGHVLMVLREMHRSHGWSFDPWAVSVPALFAA